MGLLLLPSRSIHASPPPLPPPLPPLPPPPTPPPPPPPPPPPLPSLLLLQLLRETVYTALSQNTAIIQPQHLTQHTTLTGTT